MLEKVLTILQGGILQPLPFTASGFGARVTAIIDILIVALLLLALFRFLRKTRATNILWGFLFVGLGIVVARLLNLVTVNLVLTVFFALLLFAMPFLFQPELRRGLEKLGRKGPMWRPNGQILDSQSIMEIIRALEEMQARRQGALIVLEHQTGLTEFIDTGVQINSAVRSQLLETIFFPGSPLHDGAVIIRDNLVAAAACTLPLSDAGNEARMGTRHRAALGVSEGSDALAIVLSEERGAISLAADGKLYKVSSAHDLDRMLRKLA